MCWVALGGLSGVLGLAGAAVGAYGQIQASRANAQAEMFNAAINQRNAEAVEQEQVNVQDAAAIERRRLGERIRAERGDMVAKFTAMGIDPGFGTPADLVGDLERGYQIDRSILGRNEMNELQRLDKEKADYRDTAKMGMSSAKSSLKAGSYAAAGTLLDGVSTVSQRWIQPRTPTPVPVGG